MSASTPVPRTSALWRRLGWGAAALLLLLPAVAMRFTTEVRWGPEDFLAAAVMLGLAGGALELAFRRPHARRWTVAIVAGVVVSFLLVWAELAVGILH